MGEVGFLRTAIADVEHRRLQPLLALMPGLHQIRQRAGDEHGPLERIVVRALVEAAADGVDERAEVVRILDGDVAERRERLGATEQHDFRAGSYSGYNLWRVQLSQFALGVEPSTVWENPERFAGRPFVELINFTDCDGRIGTRLAVKLAADFRAHADEAAKYAATLDEGESFLENYNDFARAFELAGQQGALAFC